MPTPSGQKLWKCPAKHTITELNKMFAAYGLPQQVVSDNGPQFVSSEFQLFIKSKHIRCSPYHPSSNGLTDRMVQTFKKAMKASAHENTSVSQRLADFLLSYCSTTHATTNKMPCTLFLGRSLRTQLDLLLPNLQKRVTTQQARQKFTHDQRSINQEFYVGQQVMARNLRPSAAWLPAIVVERLGHLIYLVDVNGQLWKRHIDHLRV